MLIKSRRVIKHLYVMKKTGMKLHCLPPSIVLVMFILPKCMVLPFHLLHGWERAGKGLSIFVATGLLICFRLCAIHL